MFWLEKRGVSFGIDQPCFGRKKRGVSFGLLGSSKRLKTFQTFACVAWSGYEDGDRCRKILGEIVHGLSDFFVKTTCDGAGDVLGGGMD